MTTTTPVIHSDPDILGGTPVFWGTRVPVKTLLDYLEAGDRLDEFLDHFPSVRREQAIAALELAKDMLDECAPRPLKRELAEYDICTVVEMGWSGKKRSPIS
jgi:uncharacterized protein (DUF433 family)